uniref:NADH-ubiquinone oxidoreductase chain 1 n=1 Tax=Talaromyces marneffei TaxID=37727 RepID=Q6V9D4_TALMA|nr:NADH dehydrogenase subunit 1 [Talaromyces marneffei]AAQ54916.1 NADH dehydrogenase subunit 1 [Talaromyces marneffei]AND96972.1 NADH dehydrogenase subunit 1 [Talaromyces marneffei]AND96988.1 NADH dehydrogenase subunit 1 [Talaromyces marneffei]AND97005.1 NADH dehydrogenase subunit 1 [Talaromyces marneffei]AND97022.1 NADH dehydrogenase subunit 1 [Talaromyces marneffei]
MYIYFLISLLSIISIAEGLLVIVPALLSVAFVTVAERKTMASMQRRLGPNIVGYYGLLQAFADALKLLLKEYVAPTQANIILFFLGPIITLIFSLLGYLVVPYGSGLYISDFSLGILYMLAVSSLATYGILLAGWSANSKYAFLGSLRSTAQLISYELILSSVILLVVLLSGSLNLISIVESQRVISFVFPLFPLFLIFFIGSIAETNRAPFDLAEESELVSGFMTEHSSVIFVFFFLAEYASIVLICALNSLLFLGGYLSIIPLDILISILNVFFNVKETILFDLIISISSSPLNLAIKTSVLIFVFIWVRASFPRIRFDQLMSVCWTVLLPVIIAYIVLIPCFVYSIDMIPVNITLI